MAIDLEKIRLEQSDFARNTSTRVPICFMIDASTSMKQQGRMRMVNEGIRQFIQDMKTDPYAMSSLELCIVTFGGQARVMLPFTEIGNVQFTDIRPNGDTPLGAATEMVIDCVEERLALYDNTGITNYNPWIIIFSDGLATDSLFGGTSYKKGARKLCRYQEENNWRVMAIALGDEPNSLADFTPKKRVYGLKDVKISDFFTFISRSVSNYSKSRPDVANFSTEEMEFEGALI